MTKEKIQAKEHYSVAVIKTVDHGTIGMACTTSHEHLYSGDLVELEDGHLATVILADNFVTGQDFPEYEKTSGMEIQRIVYYFTRREAEWPDREEAINE